LWRDSGPAKRRSVPSGLIHDWIGAAFIPATSLKKTLALIQDYDNHRNIYKPDVMASRLISHHGNDFKIYLRLLKKKIMTVVLDTRTLFPCARSGRPRAVVCPAATMTWRKLRVRRRAFHSVVIPVAGVHAAPLKYGSTVMLHSLSSHSGT